MPRAPPDGVSVCPLCSRVWLWRAQGCHASGPCGAQGAVHDIAQTQTQTHILFTFHTQPTGAKYMQAQTKCAEGATPSPQSTKHIERDWMANRQTSIATTRYAKQRPPKHYAPRKRAKGTPNKAKAPQNAKRSKANPLSERSHKFAKTCVVFEAGRCKCMYQEAEEQGMPRSRMSAQPAAVNIWCHTAVAKQHIPKRQPASARSRRPHGRHRTQANMKSRARFGNKNTANRAFQVLGRAPKTCTCTTLTCEMLGRNMTCAQ